MEHEQVESQARLLSEALDAVYDAVVITDVGGIIEWVNPAFTEMSGYSSDEAIGRNPGELLRSGEHGEAFYRDLWDTVLAGDVWRGRMINRRKNGTIYPEDQTITPVHGPDGAVAHFVAIKRDVTEQVAAEGEIRRANRALRVISGGNRALLRSTSEAEIVEETCRVAVREGGYRLACIGYVDPEAPHLLRMMASAGEDAADLEGWEIPLSGGERYSRTLDAAIRARAPVAVGSTSLSEGVPLGSGRVRDRRFRSMVAIPLASESILYGVISIFSDDPGAFDEHEMAVLSELAADLSHGIATHRVRRQKEELEERFLQTEKLRAVGQLAGGVAHDFNNYLTVITALAGGLLDDPRISSEVRDELREIQVAAQKSAQLTRQLLSFSRHRMIRLEVVDLNEVVRGMASMLDRLLGGSIVVSMDLSPTPLPVRVDPGQLDQVLMNLAVNAHDAMPEGGELKIETSMRSGSVGSVAAAEAVEERTHAVLIVRDSGVGMSEEVRARAFEPFYTNKESGTGLGLSTVYGVIRQAGGAVRFESERERGTAFEILLPLRDPAELRVRDPASEAAAVGSGRGRETVLVVEDQDPVRRVAVRILERFGYTVIECRSVAEALDWSRADEDEAQVDLVFTDLGLGDGDGREIGAAFAHRRPGMPVLYTSGYTPTATEGALELGPDESFIEKPFDPQGLVSAIRSALDAAASGERGRA